MKNERAKSFWLGIVAGVLVFVLVILANDVPERIRHGQQSQRAMQVLDAMHEPLLSAGRTEDKPVLGEEWSSYRQQLEAGVMEAQRLLRRYQHLAGDDPQLKEQTRMLAQLLTSWVAVERVFHENSSRPGAPTSEQVLETREKNHQQAVQHLIGVLRVLADAKRFVRRDIDDGRAALQLLLSSFGVLLVYLSLLVALFQRHLRRRLLTSFGEQQAVEKALVESRMMLQLVLDSIPVRVFWKDLESVYLGCNRQFARDTGFEEPARLIGRTDFEMSWNEQAERYRNDDRQVITSGEAKLDFEEPQTRPDGEGFVLRTSKIPLRDHDGQVIGVLGLYEDITARKQAEDELRRHRDHLEDLVKEQTQAVRLQAQIIDQIHDSVISTNLDGIVTSWNKGAERMFGYVAGEAIGKHIAFVYPQEEHRFLQEQVIEPLKANGEHETEVRCQRKDGSDFHALLALSLLRDEEGVLRGMIGYAMEITKRKQAEARLQEQSSLLEATNKELEAFAYSISHDLRAPLRAIDGFSQFLVDDYADRLDEEGRDLLQRVRCAAQRMGDLIDDMLAFSRLNRYELVRKTVDLSVLAERIVGKLKEAQPQREVEVRIRPDMVAEGDARLLGVVLENLLGNAWKYTGKIKRPRIEFDRYEQEGERVYCVCDNGIGFDMKYANKLFGVFQRLHGKEFEGTGIGLATVERIVHRHGGRVWAEAELDKGASFFFTL